MAAISARNAGSTGRAPRKNPGGDLGFERGAAAAGNGRRSRSDSAPALAGRFGGAAAAACSGVAHPDDAGDGVLLHRTDAEPDRRASKPVEAERPEAVGAGCVGEPPVLHHLRAPDPLLPEPAHRVRAGIARERDGPEEQHRPGGPPRDPTAACTTTAAAAEAATEVQWQAGRLSAQGR